MKYSLCLSFVFSVTAVVATHGLGAPSSQKLGSSAVKRSRGHHQNLARQSTFNFLSTDEPSIFERSLDSEIEEEERRKLAQEEGWYGEADAISDDRLTGDDEDSDTIWEEEENGSQAEEEFDDLYKRAAQKIRQLRQLPIDSPASKKSLIGYRDKVSGLSGATRRVTTRSGPNGAQLWLNHGISKSKRWSRWTPPKLKLSQLKTISLTKALQNPASPFHACRPYLKHFNAAAKKYNLPPILLASIAMQESSCSPSETGPNKGAFGLMQLIVENCKGRSGSACAEPEFNIETAAHLLSDTLSNSGGNILVALASYNGWYRGMSYNDATKQAVGPCCDCQQNLDYLQQMLNGWFLNISPHRRKLGMMKNLDICKRR